MLYISDLDGTLLNEKAEVSEKSVAILNDLLEQGLAFTVATARTHLSALPILSGLNLTLPLVLLNGCMLLDPKDGRLIEYTAFSDSAVRALQKAEALSELEGLLLTVQDGELALHISNTQEEAFRKFQNGSCTVTPKAARDIFQEEIVFAMYTAREPSRLQLIHDHLTANGGLTVDFYADRYEENRWYVELFSTSASKKDGVLRLKELCGAEELVCFGDAPNDLPMFEVCTESYAVENAHADVKRAALASIGRNTESGVARFIREHFRERNTNKKT
ncbi:MAG: HAD family phosphatase [Firmicutes bacterium]|nr:HAD family phosphatase [Bacillota bacterium]